MSIFDGFFKFISKSTFSSGLITNLAQGLPCETLKKSVNSFKNAIITALAVTLGYICISVLLGGVSSFGVIFSDVVPMMLDISVLLIFIHAAEFSSMQNSRLRKVFLILAASIFLYLIGDITWAILELVIHQQPFPSIADIFYISFYPLFALGIYYIPKTPLSQREKLKFIVDAAVVGITFCLIFMVFLVMPTIKSNGDMMGTTLSLAYLIGDILLFIALMKLLFNHFKSIRPEFLALLGMGILAMILTDGIYTYQSLHGTYISGGILDAGWVLSFVLMGLAGLLQVNTLKNSFGISKSLMWLRNFSFSPNLPIVSVIIAYILLILVSYYSISDLLYVELGVGSIVFLVMFRQLVTMNENKDLYLAATKEIERRKLVENDLKESIKEKEILMRELNHRVKNNLQVLSSLLNLQKFYVNGEEAVHVLQSTQNRVNSMALVQGMLHESNLSTVDLSVYIPQLLDGIFNIYNVDDCINVLLNVEPVFMNIETAVPFGLVISEIVSNSVKYAFPGGSGEISLDFHSFDGRFELIVGDDGVGLPENIDLSNVKGSLGLQLVKILSKQLDASVELKRNPGTTFNIKFKELDYDKRI